MRRVCPILTLGLALVLASPAAHADAPERHPGAVARWQPYIDEASLRFGIPASWIARVIRAESAGQTTRAGRPIRSRAGAMGLMQLMPATWADMRQKLVAHGLGLGRDPDEPRANILAGTFYLRLMYDRFGYPGLFGAYNAGPARYAAYLRGQQRLPAETSAYLAQVAGPVAGPVAGSVAGRGAGGVADVSVASGLSSGPAAPLPPALFAVRREGPAAPAAAGLPAPETALFAIRKAVP